MIERYNGKVGVRSYVVDLLKLKILYHFKSEKYSLEKEGEHIQNRKQE